MQKQFKEEPLIQIGSPRLKKSHVDFLNANVKNRNKFFRWMLDNNPEYKKFMKEKDGKK